MALYRRLVQSPAHVHGALAMMASWNLDSLEHDMAALVCQGVIRLESNGLIQVLQRTLQVAFLVAHSRTVGEGFGIVGLEPDGFVQVLQCALHVALATPRRAPEVEGFAEARLKPDGLV